MAGHEFSTGANLPRSQWPGRFGQVRYGSDPTSVLPADISQGILYRSAQFLLGHVFTLAIIRASIYYIERACRRNEVPHRHSSTDTLG